MSGLRKDTPQYILEWISMTVTDSRCQRAVFADRILSLKASKKIYKQYHLYRGLSEQLMSLARIYLELNKK